MKAARTIIYVLLVIGLIWLLVLLFGRVFSGNSANDNTGTKTNKQAELVSYADTDTVVSMYIDGPTRAKTEHESLRISVGRTQVQIQLMRSYGEQVVRQETFPNSTTSYAAFLKALDGAQFDAAVSTTVGDDERGVCPFNNRFVYTTEGSGTSTVRAWTSSCGVGNFRGDHALVRRLFIEQVPRQTLNDVMRGSRLSTN